MLELIIALLAHLSTCPVFRSLVYIVAILAMLGFKGTVPILPADSHRFGAEY